MKLTLANVKELKRNSSSPLFKRVCNYFIDRRGDYNDNGIISIDSAVTELPVRNSEGKIVDHRTVISDTRQVVHRAERFGVRQQRWRIAHIHRYEDDIPTPYASERIGAVQASLPFLAAHLFEYVVRVARKPESHPNAARSQGRYDDNPHLQQRRPLLFQASRRQTRLEIPLRRLKALLLNKIPRHKVGDFIFNPSSPQTNRHSPISPNGSPSPHSPPTTSIFSWNA